jgi:hypothetical protein
MSNTLPRDATLRTAYPHLKNQRQYLGGVYQKLRAVANVHGNASVKIGVKGSGQKPNYRIFYYESDRPHFEIIEGSYFDNHTSFTDEELSGDAVTYNWSTASMTFEEVNAWADELGLKRSTR